MPRRKLHVTRPDHQRLTFMLEEALARHSRDEAVLKDLAQELAKAIDVEPKDVPADVVTMNSRVVLKDLKTNEEMEYTLVFPEKADVEQGRISVVRPGAPRNVRVALRGIGRKA